MWLPENNLVGVQESVAEKKDSPAKALQLLNSDPQVLFYVICLCSS